MSLPLSSMEECGLSSKTPGDDDCLTQLIYLIHCRSRWYLYAQEA